MQLSTLQSQNLLEILEQLHLSDDLMKQMEDYIDGKVGEEVLSNLSFQEFRDSQWISFHPSASLFLTFVNAKNGLFSEAKRYFNILFAIGGPSCEKMLPDGFFDLNQDKKLGIDMDKMVAVYACWLGKMSVVERNLKIFEKMIDGKTELLQMALRYQNGQSEKGKLILYTLYFFLKYPNIQSEIFLEEEDLKRLKEYEDCVCKQVNFMLNQGLLSEEIRRISEGLHQEALSEEIKGLVRRHTKVSKVIQQAAGLVFVNYSLSRCFINFISLCMNMDWTATLNGMEDLDIRRDLRDRGGRFDKIFGIDSESYIRWAAENSYKSILQVQFVQNRETYLRCCDMENLSVSVWNLLLSAIKKLDLSIYQEKRKAAQKKAQEEIIRGITNYCSIADKVRKYLEGKEGVESLYCCEDQLNHYYYDMTQIKQYDCDYGEDEFYRRCVVLIALKQAWYFFVRDINDTNVEKKIKEIFALFEREKIDLFHQLKLFLLIEEHMMYSDFRGNKEKLIAVAKTIFSSYLSERRKEMLMVFQETGAMGRRFALDVLSERAQENKEEILSYAQNSSKLVKEKLLEILYQQTDWEEEIKSLLQSKKVAVREIAIRVLAHWDVQKYQKELEQILRQEKSTKLRALLTEVLQIGSDKEEGENVTTREVLVKELHKGGRSRTLAWAYQAPFSVVHRTDGEEASLEYLQAIFLCYSAMQPCGINANAAFLAEELQPAELAIYVNELFEKWIETGAEAKKRWVLFAASIHGGSEIIKKLQHQIQEWPQYARGAIASDAVQALALNPDPQALLIVDGIARKFKFKQVKAAAGKALDFAAAQLGLEREELEDRIVPNLGFNQQMERIFDYGERQFTVTITTALEIEVFDDSGKKLKNLPAPGKKDDTIKAAAAYEEFKQMKKQMKTTISSQKARLEWALSSERIWSAEAWKSLFVQNPLMHLFAIGLVWGIYQDRTLVQGFRYMEDGTFNTEEEEEFYLPENGRIGLVHPIELSEKSRAAWKEQMEDYEIVQPIVQLERDMFYLTEEEKQLRSLERFGGYVVNDLSLGGKLQALGWYRGSVLDAGGFYTFYREDAKIGYGVELHFSGSFVGGGGMGDVTLYDARFYKAGTIERGNYFYDEVKQENGILLCEIPQRYFSEIVLQLASVAGGSRERDENWREGRRF